MAPSLTATGIETAGSASDVAQRVLGLCRDHVSQACDGSIDGHIPSFPSERELARRLEVTRHTIRTALSDLEQRGLIKSVSLQGRSVFMLADFKPEAAVASRGIQCINFLQAHATRNHEMRWLLDAYLAGYTDVLDMYDIKTRFIFWDEGRTEYESIFWGQVPPERQGCVLIDQRMPGLLRWLNAKRAVYVVQSHCAYDELELPPHDKVYINKVGGAFEATRHLWGLGHRRIGYVGRTLETSNFAPEWEGVRSALRCEGADLRPADTRATSLELPPEAVCRAYLGQADRPTAVVAGNGAVAIRLMRAAEGMGLGVPGDLSLIGFDTAETANHPRLSTIAVPRHDLAQSAVQTLLRRHREGPGEPSRNVLPCRLELRESVSPPAGQ